MTGCLKIKNDTYYAVLNLKEGEKYKQKWISTKLKVKGNKRKATEFLNEQLAKYSNGFEIKSDKNAEEDSPGNILFTDYMLGWLERKKNKVEITTWEGYRNTIVNHLVPYFEPLHLSIRELKPKHISQYYEFEFTSKCKGKKPTLNSLKTYRAVLKNLLNQAFFEEIIDKNPAFKVPLPKKDCLEHNQKFLSVDQANELLKIFEGHWLQPIIYMALYYGLRRGEVIGLKWSAIDFKNNKVKINHIITQLATVVAKDSPKTASSKREYTLLPELKEMLKKIQAEQKRNKKLFGKSYQKSEYVFTWPDGRPYNPLSISREFPRILKKNNFPHMRFHDLRHSCASILYDKGWDLKDIQTWLGHADIQTTANIYTHISKDREKIMAKDLENTFKIAM